MKWLNNIYQNGFLMLPKESVRHLGALKSICLSYMIDIAKYAFENGKDAFFCKIEKMSEELGIDKKTAIKIIKEFETAGVLEYTQPNGTDRTKFYTINENAIIELLHIGEWKKSTSHCGKNPHSIHIYNNNKESIITNKEQDFFSKEIFENLSTSDSIKEHLNNLDKKNKVIFEKEFLAYKQKFAKKLYENSNDRVGISLELWIKYILSKDKAIKNKKRYCTLKAIEKDFKSLFKLQEMGILEKRIDDALESSWQGIWFDSDAQKYNSGNFQRQYNATKGNSGESFFSDNPDDYINPNTPGVKSVNGAVYEVDMFELLGRKD